MSKKPVIAFTVADKNNEKYAQALLNSLRKFHTEEELPLKIIKGEELEGYLKDDKMFYYRQKPIIAEPLLKEYELVIGMDCDQIVLGKLDYLLKTKDFDVATVLNWNRYDPQRYGFITFQGILPVEYMNCGLVCMRSEKFVHDWKLLCFTPQFDRVQYREQDLLNIMIYYGNWNIRCLDHQDKIGGNESWWGLIGKLEWSRAELRGEKIIVPKGFGDTPFPPQDTELKIVHMAGGPVKEQWGKFFSPEIMKRINYLIT